MGQQSVAALRDGVGEERTRLVTAHHISTLAHPQVLEEAIVGGWKSSQDETAGTEEESALKEFFLVSEQSRGQPRVGSLSH